MCNRARGGLWTTDGSTARTQRVVDLHPAGSGFPRELRNAGGVLLFAADDGVHGEELWRSDGTAAGTRLVADLHPRGSSHPKSRVVLPGRVVFTATDGEGGEQLWVLRDCHGAAGANAPCVLERIPLPAIERPDRGRPRRVADIRPGAAGRGPMGSRRSAAAWSSRRIATTSAPSSG